MQRSKAASSSCSGGSSPRLASVLELAVDWTSSSSSRATERLRGAPFSAGSKNASCEAISLHLSLVEGVAAVFQIFKEAGVAPMIDGH